MKELIEFIGDSAYYEDYGQYIFGRKDDKMQMIGEVRGWGAIQNLFKTEAEALKFQDELGKFIAEAITEKIQRYSAGKEAEGERELTKDEAKKALYNGEKLTHRHFTDNEYIQLLNFEIISEDGVKHPYFWDLKEGEGWESGWKIFTPPTV